jgi:excisionase family DNA binding protein
MPRPQDSRERDTRLALREPAVWVALFSGGTPPRARRRRRHATRSGESLRSIPPGCASMLVPDGDRAEADLAVTVEVTVTNPAYWSDRAPQLAQILRSARDTGPRAIPDPTGKPPDPDRLVAIVDPSYWSDRPRELAEVLTLAARGVSAGPDAEIRLPAGAAGATSGSQERLTMTVDEAAAALGISRAHAFNAVARNEIPHIRIGRRILIPRAALERMLSGNDE